MAEANFRPPPVLDLNDDNIADVYRKFRRQLDVYMTATGVVEKSKERQTAVILQAAGPQMIEVYDHFIFQDGEDKNDPATVLKKMDEYCRPRQNVVMHTFRFWQTPMSEPFDTFLTDLRTKADSCEFGEQKERMIRDKVIFTTKGKLQELLLRESEKLNLKKAIDICRAYEMSQKQTKEISGTAGGQSISRVARGRKDQKTNSYQKQGEKRAGSKPHTARSTQYRPGQGQKNKGKQGPTHVANCKFCGQSYEKGCTNCPAWNQTCTNCGGRNHFAKVCTRKVNQVSQQNEDEDWHWLQSINRIDSKEGWKEATTLMKVNDIEVRFQIDTAADVNKICHKYVKRSQVKKSKQKLTMWNLTKFEPIGEAKLKLENPKTNRSYEVIFTVVPNNLNCLIGLETSKKMGLVTINQDKFISSVELNSDLGDLGTAHLYVDENVQPKTLPCRPIALAVQEQVKAEIDKLVEREVLIPIEKPTPWVSQLVV